MAAQTLPFVTPEQYLEMERGAGEKHEYLAGEMYAIAGGNLAHSLIAVLISSELSRAVAGRCRVGNSDLRVAVSPSGPYFYPDASVVWGELRREDLAADTVSSPILIVEVLSPSTEAFDRGEKFNQYRKLASLKEYVLISQTRHQIETFVRNGQGKWVFSLFSGADAICRFESIQCEIPLSAIYLGIPLE